MQNQTFNTQIYIKIDLPDQENISEAKELQTLEEKGEGQKWNEKNIKLHTEENQITKSSTVIRERKEGG